jgi:hypothetical protein
MDSFDDPERRTHILTRDSLEKLRELFDVAAWTRWIKEKIELNDAQMQAMMEREIQRGKEAAGEGNKDKWKVQIRIETQSHSIRPKVLKIWNDSMPWIKLLAVQGARNKRELLVELTLREHVPLQGLWNYSLGIANHFIMALNMATSGLWWWVLPRHKTRFYDKIQDLENKCAVRLDQTDMQVFSGPLPAINEVNMNMLKACFVALPNPTEQDRASAYNMFLSLSDVHWRCEGQAFGNFLQSLKLLVVEAQYAKPSEKLSDTIGRLLKEKFPQLDASQHEAFVKLIEAFQASTDEQLKVQPADAYLIKLLCETLFRDSIVPSVLKERWGDQGRYPATPPHSSRG